MSPAHKSGGGETPSNHNVQRSNLRLARAGAFLALALAMPIVFALMHKALGLSIFEVVSALLPPALISSAMTACISAKKVCILPHASALAKDPVLIFVSAPFYTGSFALWAHLRELLADIRPILPKPLANRLGQYARLA